MYTYNMAAATLNIDSTYIYSNDVIVTLSIQLLFRLCLKMHDNITVKVTSIASRIYSEHVGVGRLHDTPSIVN